MNTLEHYKARLEAAHNRVVNIHHKASYDQYIGRARRGEPENIWANPITLDECNGNRELCLIRYMGHLQRTKLYARAHELLGKRLGCFCSPKWCHGHVLARLSIEPTPKLAQRQLQIMIRDAVAAYTRGVPLVVAVSGSRELTHELRPGGGAEHHEAFDQDMTEIYAGLSAMPWDTAELHHGACKGADLLAAHWAQRMTTARVVAHPVEDWSHGAWQGPARNKEMLENSQAFAAFWDGKLEKSGTRDFVGRAWNSKDWICWSVPVQSKRITMRFYGVRWNYLRMTPSISKNNLKLIIDKEISMLHNPKHQRGS